MSYILFLFGLQFILHGITTFIGDGWVSAGVWFGGALVVAVTALVVDRSYARAGAEPAGKP